MAKSSDTIPWAIVVLLLGGTLYKPIVNPSSDDRAPQGAERGAGSDSARPGQAGQAKEAPRAPSLPHKDALDLLAAHFGIDISEEALAVRAREAARTLATDRGANGQSAAGQAARQVFDVDQRDAVADLLGAPDDRLRLYGVTRERLRALLGNPLLRPETIRVRPNGTPALDPKKAREFLEDYLWRDRDDFRLKLVMDAKQAAGVTRLDAIVATVPDPIDSNVRWMFDPMVDALQRAAADSDYVLDRFYVPDWKPTAGDATPYSELAIVHEQWPGIILFRREGRHELLVVFLVAETATTGIHQSALARALSFKAMLDPTNPIRILGPSFSGSIDSLVHTLNGFSASRADATFRIVSGGVTSPNARKTLESEIAKTSFRSTVLPDSALLDGVARHLYAIDPTLGTGRRVALLVEANTTYGRALLQKSACHPDAVPQAAAGANPPAGPANAAAASNRPFPEDATADDSGRFTFSDWWSAFASTTVPCETDQIIGTALRVPFPMHISRLRAQADPGQSKGQPAPSGPTLFHSLSLDEPGVATDQMPAFSPKLTASAVELIVANILATLRRERVTTVGIIGTDTRDKLFLAQRIAQAAPSMTMFTVESDLLFVHPDYNTYARGMIIASTYPLFAQNQAWTSRSGEPRQRQLFSMTNSQGVYNAVLTLLDYDAAGRASGERTVPLADYRPPAPALCHDDGCVPPVWISVVGRDAVWPIGVYYSTDKNQTAAAGSALDFSQVQHVFQGAARTRGTVHPSGPMTIFLWLFGLLCAASTWMFWRWRLYDPQVRTGGRLTGINRGAPAVVYQRVALTTLFIAGVPVAFVAFLALRITLWSGALDWVTDLFALAAVFGVGGAALRAWSSEDERPAGAPVALEVKAMRAVLAACAGLVTAAAFAFLVRYAWTFSGSFAEPVALTRYAVRALQLGNGVTPLVPILLIALPIYGWAVMQLWHSGGPSMAAIVQADWIEPLIGERDDQWRLALWRTASSSTSGVPCAWLMAVLGGFIATAVFAMRLNIVTIEPFAFSWFLVCAWLMMQLFVALTLARAIYAWTLTSRLLHGLASTMLLPSFGRVPRELFGAQNRFAVPPSRSDLVIAARQRERLAAALDTLDGGVPSAVLATPEVTALRNRFQTERVPTALAEIDRVPWSDTPAFASMMGDVPALLAVLKPRWADEDTAAFLKRAPVTDTDDGVRLWVMRAEEYIAMLLALFVRELISRVIVGLLYVTAALLLMAAALSSFPIHPWQPLMAFIWMWTLAGAVAGVGVAIGIERDPVISRLSGTSPNRVTWNMAFVSKVFVYAFIPILTLFAAQFPDIGGALLHWFGPVQPLP